MLLSTVYLTLHAQFIAAQGMTTCVGIIQFEEVLAWFKSNITYRLSFTAYLNQIKREQSA